VKHSGQVYRVFREAVIEDEGVYSSRLYREGTVGSREDANRLLSKLNQMDLMEKGRRTKAQYYVPNWEGVAEYISELFSSETSLPVEFVKRYIEVYVREHQTSTLAEMLSDYLASSLRSYLDSGYELPDAVMEFVKESGIDADPGPGQYVEYALGEEDSVLAEEREDYD